MNKREGTIVSILIGLIIGLLIIAFGLIPERSRNHGQVRNVTIENYPIVTEETEVETENETETEEETEVDNEVETEAELGEIEPYFNYSEEDIYLVGNTVFNEVGIFFQTLSQEEAEKAAYYTASCVVNRAKMNYLGLGTTISSQLVPSQYASAGKITSEKESYVSDKIYQIAEDVLENGPAVSEKLIYQSEFEQGDEIDTVGNQHFGLLP